MHFAFLPPIQSSIILTYNIPSYCSSPYFQKIINSLNMSRSTIADSHFGVCATDFNFTSNSSLVNFHSHPLPTGSNLPEGQMASLDYDPAHACPGCQGYFEWEGEVKTAKRSCWGCGAWDEYRHQVEPIVEGMNVGGHMEVASTPELANLGHLVYQLNNKVAFLEQCLVQEEKKVVELEVINRELAVGYSHLMEFHVGPSEAALRAAATAFLLFLFRCKSVKFGCEESAPVSDGQFGEAFAGGIRSGSSSSSDRVPPLEPCSDGDNSSSSISPLSSSTGQSVVISSGGSLWAYLPPVSEGEEERAEVSAVEIEHLPEVEGTGEESSESSSVVSESGSGWWFSPERRFLPEL